MHDTSPEILAQKKIAENERSLRLMIHQAPVAIAIFRGPDYVVEVVNPRALELWGRKEEEVINKPIFTAMPELLEQGVKGLLDDVYKTATPFSATELPVQIIRNNKPETAYINFVYEALYDIEGAINGIMTVGTEVTEQVVARKKLANAEERTRLAIDSAAMGTFDQNFITGEVICSKRFCEIFGFFDRDNVSVEEVVKIMHPDDQHLRDEATERAEVTGALNYEVRAIWPDKSIHWVNVRATFFYDDLDTKKPVRLVGTAIDITAQRTFLSSFHASEQKFRNTVKQAPIGITILTGPEFMVEMANEAYLEVVDRKEADFVGRPLFDSLPEVKDSVSSLLTKVLTTGEPYYGVEFPIPINRHGKAELGYFDFVYAAFKDEQEKTAGIIVTVTDVSASVKARHSLSESEKQFRNLMMQSPIPMTIFMGEDYIIELANTAMYNEIWRRHEADVAGKKVLDVFPELKQQKYPELLREVFTTGRPYTENESIAYVQGDDGLKKFYLDFEYSPLFGTDGKVSGIMVTVSDVTEKVEARHKVEDAELRLRLATEATGIATWDLDLNTRDIIYSAQLAEIFGHPITRKITHPNMREQIHADDLPEVESAFDRAMQTGIYHYEARVVKPDKSVAWIGTQGRVFYDEKKQPVKLIGTLRDITEEKFYQQELQEREQKFRQLADSMPIQVWTADAEGNLYYYNKSVFDFSGLTLEEINRGGWLQIVHPDDRDANIAEWVKAITTGTDFFFEHRFRRYDGTYRWQLSRATPQRDAAGKIQMWVGSSTDIQDQKMFANELEIQVQERTGELEQKNKELEKMNAELQSFAYVSSHDLQEPLRKIQVFANRILEKESENLSETGKDYFRRMQSASSRMQTLILDLLAYSRTSTYDRVLLKTNLNTIIDDVKIDLKDTLADTHAIIEARDLCEVDIVPFQFRQLMSNLLGNSLKFARAGVPPVIKITAENKSGSQLDIPGLAADKIYCHVRIADNGIGFDAKYKDRIFEVFQRLHPHDQYKGTGIGLAIVKKIIDHHNGVITATGELNTGATFDIYIPAS